MTYQSPGLARRSFLSATAGSTSSSSSARRLGGGLGRLVGGGVVGGSSAPRRPPRRAGSSARRPRCTSAVAVRGFDATRRTQPKAIAVEGSHGLSVLSNMSARRRRQPNTSITSLARPRSTRPINVTMNARNDQHHRGVGDHLLAVRPDHLAQLGDDLLQVVEDEGERVARRPSPAFLALLGLLGVWPFLVVAASVTVDRVDASLTSSTAPRRDRLPVGRCGRVTTAV